MGESKEETIEAILELSLFIVFGKTATCIYFSVISQSAGIFHDYYILSFEDLLSKIHGISALCLSFLRLTCVTGRE